MVVNSRRVIFGQVFNLSCSSVSNVGLLFRDYGPTAAVDPVTHKLLSHWMWDIWKIEALAFDQHPLPNHIDNGQSSKLRLWLAVMVFDE